MLGLGANAWFLIPLVNYRETIRYSPNVGLAYTGFTTVDNVFSLLLRISPSPIGSTACHNCTSSCRSSAGGGGRRHRRRRPVCPPPRLLALTAAVIVGLVAVLCWVMDTLGRFAGGTGLPQVLQVIQFPYRLSSYVLLCAARADADRPPLCGPPARRAPPRRPARCSVCWSRRRGPGRLRPSPGLDCQYVRSGHARARGPSTICPAPGTIATTSTTRCRSSTLTPSSPSGRGSRRWGPASTLIGGAVLPAQARSARGEDERRPFPLIEFVPPRCSSASFRTTRWCACPDQATPSGSSCGVPHARPDDRHPGDGGLPGGRGRTAELSGSGR